MNSEQEIRMESDPLGNLILPKDAYYGSQTQRAVENFQISGIKLPREFIKAQGIIKAASATANMEVGMLPPDIATAIIKACEEIIEGKWDEHFVVDVYQAGAGTSQNTNANEVIAKRATEIIAGKVKIHPNDHVNMSQSSNDTFPTALNIASVQTLNEKLLPAIKLLHEELDNKANQFMPVVKAGRTHLHDGVPIRLGQEFSGYAETIHSVYLHIEQNLESLYEIGLGGNAVGTPIGLHPEYIPKVIKEVCNRTGYPFRQPANIFSFMQNMNYPIRCLQTLKELSLHLMKIIMDLRLLSSGPRTGLAEINLPSVQPGSTIMPGKVNPAIIEMVYMVCCQVIGYEQAVSVAAISSQLEINVFTPLISHSFLTSINILSNAISTMVNKCINGIDANEMVCKKWLDQSLSLVTGLSPILGYDLASQLGLKADEENKTLKQILQEKGLYKDEYINAIDPMNLL